MLYLDTSAAVKIIRVEPESGALRTWLRGQLDRTLLSTVLLRTELPRAIGYALAHGVIDPSLAERYHASTRLLLARSRLVQLSDELLDRAGSVGPPLLRSLDALHLVTALQFTAELTGFLTYDHRLGDAAGDAGLPVFSPGAG